ncbi:WD40 repeat domain-containing protein [Lentzea tibetensis]|uniref:WD40 repeat domain-containing protein n=1 Tax=Lentzea tibetensis TaxID=2591470 RepID=A0A563EMQ3_9PSEU|nr:WD40 repeat domain-containing protein [Lentzea tibetensis]TWP48468.1 WD40 repeat domain-containing protein [Lentzea tibetensis]
MTDLLAAAELDAVAGLLPSVPGSASPAWWALPDSHSHRFGDVAAHLAATGRVDELARLVVDLRWVAARLAHGGVPGVLEDLALVDDPVAAVLARMIGRAGHRLEPTPPAARLGPALAGLLSSTPDLVPLVEAYVPTLPLPYLIDRWPVPDRNHPALRRVLSPPWGTTKTMVLAPDGTWLASAGRDGVVRIWDPATGGPLASLEGHQGAITALAAAADGSWLASAGEDRTVRIWDAAGEELPRSLSDVDVKVTALAAAPDGTTLALAGEDQRVWLHDIGGQLPPRRLVGSAGEVAAMRYGPDGTWLVTLAGNGAVRVWDLVSGRARTVVESVTPSVVRRYGPFTTLAVAPDGSWLVTAGQDETRTARVLDVATGEVRATLSGHTSAVTCAAVSPDGAWIATGSGDNDVRVWDPVTGEQRAVLPGNGGLVTAVAIAPDGAWLAAAGYVGAVHLWDAGGVPVAAVPYVFGVENLAVAPDGTWLAACAGRTLELRRTTDGTVRSALNVGSTPNALAIAPDGTWLATAHFDEICVWDAGTGDKRLTMARGGGLVRGLAVAPDGTWLAAVDTGDTRRYDSARDGKLRIWDTSTGKLRATLAGHHGEVSAVAVSPDGTWIATGGTDGTIRTWDVATREMRVTMRSRAHRVNAVVIAPDGTWLASGGSFEDIWILDTATGEIRGQIRTKGGQVSWLALSPDGTRLASVCWGAVEVWQVATRRLEVAARMPEQSFQCDWLPDGSGLCVGGKDGVHLLDLVSG